MVDEVKTPARRYDNRGRRSQADARRAAILRAGHDLLLTGGYRATTMAAVARAAGVSVETVYKAFGTKPELVRQILETAVVGDDEPVALIERPAMRAALQARSGADVLTAFADASSAIFIRIGPLLAAVLVAGRNGEPELRDIAAQANHQRLLDIRRVVDAVAASGDLAPSLDAARAADALWAVSSAEVHEQLTVDRAWSEADYRDWLVATLHATLLRSPPRA